MAEQKNIFTVPEAARYCSVDRVTLWRWVKSGSIKAWITPGGHHRIAKDDLEEFIHEKGLAIPKQNDTPKKKILIVDDDVIVQKVLTKLLKTYGYTTDTASDGFEAGVKVMRFKPDLIILDLIMPGMDGFDVCRFVKTNTVTSHIKIISLTGYDTEDNQRRILEAGADCALIKPTKEDELLYHIDKLLDNSHRHADEITISAKKR